jgi:predicted transcriptional regulator
MEIQTPTTFIEKYLNFGVGDSLATLFANGDKITKYAEPYSKVLDSISKYQTLYKQKLSNPELVIEYLENLILTHVNKDYQKINVFDADTNYFLKGVMESYNEKFSSIVNKMNINHIIKMIDYTNEKSATDNTFKILMNTYFKLFADKILYGKFGKSDSPLFEQIDNNWSAINLENLLKFVDILSKLKYFKADTTKYEQVFQTKFDDIANINKLLDFVNKNYILAKDASSVSDINQNLKDLHKDDELKYNFRFIIDNLKSNGFLLFEQYWKNIQSRYESINISTLNRDLKLVKHFMSIISQNEQTNVNRYVNEMLIKIRNYLFDLQESYYNNQTYQKIKIRAESDKYKTMDMNIYNRDLTTFKVLKYNYYTNPNSPTNILARAHNLETGESLTEAKNITVNYQNTSKILAGYLDIYRSYYKTRYPDREIEYDLIDSTMIVKMKFADNPYYIHMALIQYMVLDKIMENEKGISVQSISEQLTIPASKLNETFNSLLKIRIVKRSMGSNDISSVKFILNKDFSFEKNKLSISGLVKKDISESKPTQREFLHTRDMIVLCNLIHYAKKNTYFSADTIGEQLGYKIPFKVSDEQITKAIEKALDDDYIKVQEIPNSNGQIDIMYQYNDE